MKRKKCYRCGGKGKIEEGLSISVMVRCPICGGKGWRELREGVE